MRHGSLFSGIGGFDLAAEWMGWENVFHCEWNSFGQRVLKHYWPKAKSYHDITQTDFTIHRGSIDILTGGFPCQPYSMAGKRKGKEDERHLWPEMLRVIREVAPKYIVGENVLGLVNWDGGLVFDEVQADLESEGYEVAAVVIPAAAVNAPHGRNRVWFVATNTSCDANGLRTKGRMGMDGEILEGRKGKKASNGFNNKRKNADVTDTNSNGFHQRNGNDDINTGEGREYALGDIGAGDDDGLTADADNAGNTTPRCGIERNRTEESEEREYSQPEFNGHGVDGLTADTTSTGRGEDNGERKSRFNDQKSSPNDWDNFPTQSPICSGDDGLPRELDGITFSKWRNESIKAYGNAIVPQVAFEIFKVIKKIETQP